MIILFYFNETVRVERQQFNQKLQTVFEKIPDPSLKNISFDHIYVTTVSDFKFHVKKLLEIGYKEENIKILDPKSIIEDPNFPKHIGFGQNLKSELNGFDKPEFNVAIINAMSNAIGDHLIGMHAFGEFKNQLDEILPDSKVNIDLFQLNPIQLGNITRQWKGKYRGVFVLPNRLSKLMEYDAWIDLGGLIQRPTFDKVPMIDFFFQSLSINPDDVPVQNKRMSYSVSDEAKKDIDHVFKVIRSQKRPILLFHHTSTSIIRGMKESNAKNFIRQIIEKTDYLVISACGLDYQNKRFLDISNYSKSLDHFASIISRVDGIITVDTCTYHIADAFNTPTVVLFTTIDPDLRSKYYPYVESIMLETKDGKLYGRHKVSENEENGLLEIDYINKKWAEFDIQDAINGLNRIQKLKETK